MHGHHWKAFGVLAATLGAMTIYWANENGYRTEARCLTAGAILAGGVAAAIGIFTDGEQRQAHYELLEAHMAQGTQPPPAAPAQTGQLQALQVLRMMR